MKFNYTLIFGGKSSIEVRIDSISEEYLKDLRETPSDELFYKMYDENYGDELHIYGICPYAGFIEVFKKPTGESDSYEELGKPIMTLHGEKSGKIKLETIEPSPQPNSIIAACITNQDGIMGHIDLELDAPFEPANLTVIYKSAKHFNADSAITGIKYKNGQELIEEYIDGTYYTNTMPKGEMFRCLKFDKKLKATSLFEYGEWV